MRWVEELTGLMMLEDGTIDGLDPSLWKERQASLPDFLKSDFAEKRSYPPRDVGTE
jgi:hypothetical protein